MSIQNEAETIITQQYLKMGIQKEVYDFGHSIEAGLKERFEHFPFKVEVLSRFRAPAQQEQIITELLKGNIDLIIGTHRLLSKDVRFKDLGLLVIDE